MRPGKRVLWGIGAIGLALIFAALVSGQTEIPFKTGLKLATPEQLRGVPLAFTPFAGAELPPRVDLSKDMPPPGFQGNLNSCVGWAMAYGLKSYQEKLEQKRPYFKGTNIDSNAVFSPSFAGFVVPTMRSTSSRMRRSIRFRSVPSDTPTASAISRFVARPFSSRMLRM